MIELENPLGMSRVVNHEKPDVVLTDVDVPTMEGDEAVEILLKHRLHPCKVLLYSGCAPPKLELLARNGGATVFVPKTANAPLATAIRAYLDG